MGVNANIVIWCLNQQDNIVVQNKCAMTACVHNDQSVDFGCLQIMLGRQSLPIDLQHFFRHDRKRKSQVMRDGSRLVALAGKIMKRVDEAAYQSLPIEKALQDAWLIYVDRQPLLKQSGEIFGLLPSFMFHIKSEFWIDILQKHREELEETEWLTPAPAKELKKLCDLLLSTKEN